MNRIIRCSTTFGLAVAIGSALLLGCERRPVPIKEFDDFVEAHRCRSATDTGCLEQLTHYACSSGCARTGYSHRWEQPGRLDIHLTLDFLRKLRNAANAYPDVVSKHSLGMKLGDLLWSELQMMLTHPSVRFYDANRNLLAPAAVRTGNVVDPARFDSVTWVNAGGTAHAMVQADLGLWLLTLARGVPQQGDWYLRLSERVFRSFGIPDAEGGVRNDRAGNRCFQNRYCYWFHSFPVGDEAYPMTVLNQHLHAVRDAMIAHDLLAAWRDYGALGPDGQIHPLPAEFDSSHIDQLREWGRGGLFQLAYAAGNQAIPTAPPNLAEFLAEADMVDGVQRYRAHYRYDIDAAPPDISPDISAENTCHYHYHSIKVMAEILQLIVDKSYFASDPDFVGVYYKLLYGRNEGDTRSCNNRSSIPPSRRVMRGVPLADLYIGSVLEQGFQNSCSKGEPEAFRSGADDFESAAPFYDAAYEACVF